MFESLSDRLSGAFRALGGRTRLTEDNIRDGLREVRLALLEADVNFKVVKDFVERVRERTLGQAVEKSLTPSQQLVKAVHDELVQLLGGETASLDPRGGATDGIGAIMLVGLQGSGKTTSAGKLANLLRRQKMRPYLVSVDVYRPAAIEQLRTLARQLDIPCFASSPEMKPVDIVAAAREDARARQCTTLILDTAGRLHIDEALMQELADLKQAVRPGEILFVADAMTGQDAVTVAEAFNRDLDLTGVILTKMDGDARGGAALSIKSVTGTPIKYVGTGEKLSDLEVFHPDRVAGRILGMGDVLTLIEKAQSSIEAEEAEAMAAKLRKATFNFEDFRTQMRRMRQIGSLESILKLIPGLGGLTAKLGDMKVPEQEMARTEAIINSMTLKERRSPDILNASRRQRIARGAGVSVQQVNQTLRQFEQMRKMMRQVMNGGRGAKGPVLPNIPGGLGGGLPGMGGFAGRGGGFPGLPGGVGSGRSATKKKKNERTRRKGKKR